MATGLDAVFRPRSVAVIGASRRRGTLSGEIFHNLLSHGFNGAVYPVNPGAEVIQSVRAYARLGDIPDPVDLAVIVVPAAEVPAAVDDCVAKQVGAVLVITAGFAEVGDAGRAVQEQLVEKLRRAGIRMVGPNCLGIINTDPAVQLNATFAPTWPPAGSVAFSSQSGALGQAILDYARERRVGIRQFVSVGNKADVSGNDLLEYWEKDPETRVILLYLESFGNPRRFMEIASRVARQKPIAMVKSGRTEAGARAASSHTGSLAGLDVAVDALLGQAGVLRVDTISELFDVAMLLGGQPVPAGARVAILTNAGGPGIMATDACESRGLRVVPLQAETEAALREFLPREASVRNPVDMIASASAVSYERALRLLLADPGVDSVIVLFVPPIITDALDVANAICRASRDAANKPILSCFLGTHGRPDGLSALREAQLPSYAFPEAAAIALAHAVRYGRWLRREPGQVATPSGIDRPRAAAALASSRGDGDRWLTPDAVREVLLAYGLRLPASEVVTTVEDAARAAERIGFPVALKLVSATITHKSDVGGVVLGLEDAEAVRAAFDDLHTRLAHAGLGDAIDGVLVQQMVPSGVETFVGITTDPAFGPLVGFGIGGVEIEVWRDVVFRVAPVNAIDAREMVDQIRGIALIRGFRGALPRDRVALEDAILRVSELIRDFPEVRELDVNPLLALPEGHGALVLDARIRIAPLLA
jgi:acetyl coenzyme A synthetase (ADP forming)-like protein